MHSVHFQFHLSFLFFCLDRFFYTRHSLLIRPCLFFNRFRLIRSSQLFSAQSASSFSLAFRFILVTYFVPFNNPKKSSFLSIHQLHLSSSLCSASVGFIHAVNISPHDPFLFSLVPLFSDIRLYLFNLVAGHSLALRLACSHRCLLLLRNTGYQNMPSPPQTELEYVVNHVVFLPRTPNAEDDLAFGTQVLFSRLMSCIRDFKQFVPSQDLLLWNRLLQTFAFAHAAHKENQLISSDVKRGLSDLEAGDQLLFHVNAQNAVVVVRRPIGNCNQVIIEAFEASPESEAVLEAKKALLWNFPACAVAVPLDTFKEETFKITFATYLEKLSSQSVSMSMPTVGAATIESRLTPHPQMVTEWLITVLEGFGKRTDPEILQKRVYDDVAWNNAKNPWRRSPIWLAARVILQRTLCFALGVEDGEASYKTFVAFVLAGICQEITNAEWESVDAIAFTTNKTRSSRA